ncbi:methionyl-tRNA formyltransferase [Amylibacter kogurei]|uniref:Methionyl-tRNA formyltransferase n=1 Tax=Paramylibacter kogurei TaxID=1889778 RepID=A0A2G5K143_9RHOB|nr:methionyl-tRNA formyltransferase [Amylibacter kogurei]PIB23247.1 methionyl-tRNA formyltransferase [Amylibacter kogurei]
MRVVFMGTPDFSVPVLQSLVDAGHEIAAVYCQPPRPAGRGKKDRLTPVHVRAEQLGLTVRTPLNFKDKDDIAEFAALNADVAVVVAYGLILPQVILDAPINGCLNIHASLLPRWRGAAPIHRAIMAGDDETGVCIMQMEAGLDTGPVLTRCTTKIKSEDTTATLHDRLSQLGADLIVETLAQLDQLTAITQPEDGVTYAKKITKEEAAINWDQSAEIVDRHIRALSPFPGAWFEIDGNRIKVLMSKTVDMEGDAGTILDNHLSVACKSGAVQLLKLQRAGKGPMDAEIFQRGFELAKGKSLRS